MDKIINFVKQVGKFLFHYKFTIVCLLYLCLVTFLAVSTPMEPYPGKPAIFNALSFVLIFILLAKIKNKKLGIILTIFISIWISFDAFFAFQYKSVVTLGIMASIIETNSLEAKEALGLALIPAIIIISITTSLIFLSKKELSKVSFPTKYILLSLLLYWFLFMPAIFGRKMYVNEVWRGAFKIHPLTSIQTIYSKHFPIIYSDFFTFLAYQREMYELREYNKFERLLPSSISLSDSLETPQTIFFILGESSKKDHYSLYGYPVSTTPFLDSLNLYSEQFGYYEGIAPATFTREALRIIFSFETPINKKPFFKEKNLLDLAHSAGYETLWISNQPQREFDGGYIDLITSTAMNRYFMEEPYDDLDLVAYADSLYNPSKKQFFVLHLAGSHLTYSSKYDKLDLEAIPGDDNNFTIQYDRTIHHTDRVLCDAYHLMERGKSSALIYFPDHGEIIGVGHGLKREGTDIFDIPIITINNSPLDIDKIISNYQMPESKLINTSSAIYFISELMGYEVADSTYKKVLEDSKFILHADATVCDYESLK